MVLYVPPLSLPLFFFFFCLADAKHGLASKEFGWALIVSDAKGSSYKGGKKRWFRFPNTASPCFYVDLTVTLWPNAHFLSHRKHEVESECKRRSHENTNWVQSPVSNTDLLLSFIAAETGVRQALVLPRLWRDENSFIVILPPVITCHFMALSSALFGVICNGN